MYKNCEILKIFNSIHNMDELGKVGDTFKWLIDNNFIERTPFLHAVSMDAFRRIIQ
jgi:hypothetical protein